MTLFLLKSYWKQLLTGLVGFAIVTALYVAIYNQGAASVQTKWDKEKTEQLELRNQTERKRIDDAAKIDFNTLSVLNALNGLPVETTAKPLPKASTDTCNIAASLQRERASLYRIIDKDTITIHECEQVIRSDRE